MQYLDLMGLNCPIPVLKTKKFLATINSGEDVTITTSDPASELDLQEFCRKTGNKLLQQIITPDLITTIIKRR